MEGPSFDRHQSTLQVGFNARPARQHALDQAHTRTKDGVRNMNVKSKLARTVAAGAIAATLGTLAISTPAQAFADPAHIELFPADSGITYRLTYGASILDVTATFSNRTVTIQGTIKAVSGSRTASFVSYNPNLSCYDPQTRTAPVGTLLPYHFTTPSCSQPGGYSEVDVVFPAI